MSFKSREKALVVGQRERERPWVGVFFLLNLVLGKYNGLGSSFDDLRSNGNSLGSGSDGLGSNFDFFFFCI